MKRPRSELIEILLERNKRYQQLKGKPSPPPDSEDLREEDLPLFKFCQVAYSVINLLSGQPDSVAFDPSSIEKAPDPDTLYRVRKGRLTITMHGASLEEHYFRVALGNKSIQGKTLQELRQKMRK